MPESMCRRVAAAAQRDMRDARIVAGDNDNVSYSPEQRNYSAVAIFCQYPLGRGNTVPRLPLPAPATACSRSAYMLKSPRRKSIDPDTSIR